MGEVRVFVSHSSQDGAFTRALVEVLRDLDADVWYDEKDLGSGVLREVISRELSSRDCFIVVLSKGALTSQWVRDECNWAYDLYRGGRITKYVPVVIETLDERDFDELLFLNSLKRVEAPGRQPYSPNEAIVQVVQMLALTPQPSPFGRTRTAALHIVRAMSMNIQVLRGVRLILAAQAKDHEMMLRNIDFVVVHGNLPGACSQEFAR